MYQQQQWYQISMAQVYQGYIWQKKSFLFSTDHSGKYTQTQSQKRLRWYVKNSHNDHSE